MYSRANPFHAKLISRFRLNKTGSTKETWHVAVNMAGSGISYRPGDSFGICPENDHSLVENILIACNFSGDEPIDHEAKAIRRWLQKNANLATPTRKFLQVLVHHKAHDLEKYLQPESEDLLRDYIGLHTVLEVIEQHPQVQLTPQDLVSTLSPLLPRLYSIASSQTVARDEVHFTVSRVRYELQGRKRLGICSHFLCDMVNNEASVPIYLQPTKDFLLPEDNQVPIIMIGPGTGVAPFRAFMQERLSRANPTPQNWLFFGERHRAHDFFYEEYWQELALRGMLKLDIAFSRDQDEKMYVQHKMWQAKNGLWKWLQDGAKIYVCGAMGMAKDVEKCLLDIIKDQGLHSDESAKRYLTDLRRQKRYLRDVY